MDDEDRWLAAYISAACIAIGVGIYSESWGIGCICAGTMGLVLVGVSLASSYWYEIKKFYESRYDNARNEGEAA